MPPLVSSVLLVALIVLIINVVVKLFMTGCYCPADKRENSRRMQIWAYCLEEYWQANGKYPATLKEALSTTNAQRYIKGIANPYVDYFGKAILYEGYDRAYVLKSAGKDGKFATEDDVGDNVGLLNR